MEPLAKMRRYSASLGRPSVPVQSSGSVRVVHVTLGEEPFFCSATMEIIV
jgi:hypothetical protein